MWQLYSWQMYLNPSTETSMQKEKKKGIKIPFNMQNGTFNSDTVFLTNMYVYEYFNTQFINVEPIIDLHCVMYISNTVLCHIELQLLID